MLVTRRHSLLPSVVLLFALAAGCSDPPTPPAGKRPIVVIGIDGGEWTVIERLWAQNRLQHLRSLADRGTHGELKTAYNSSPVIWTTIATGVVPQRHGITDFVVPSPRGDIPVSSGLRKVPALWNMTTRAGRRTAVLGWWASWPAEPIRGVVVSDRVLLELPDRVSPADYQATVDATLAAAKAERTRFRFDEEAERRDLLMAKLGRDRLVEREDDLLLLYFRSPDVVSHRYWRYFEPEAFPPQPVAEIERHRDRIPRVYEAVDDAIGTLLSVAPEANYLVVSDHGFHATSREEETKVLLDLDAVFERLGYLVRVDGAIDYARSRCFSYNSPNFRRARYVRFSLRGREPGAHVEPSQVDSLRRTLAADLATVTYRGGEPVFFVRSPKGREIRKGADLVVGVSPVGASEELLIAGVPYRGAVSGVDRISGTHTTTTHGILIAAGPDIRREAPLEDIDVHDIAPTILYALGLPVAKDFDGEVHPALFTDEFRRRHPLRTIASWGVLSSEGARTSAADEKLLDELRSLGYIQ